MTDVWLERQMTVTYEALRMTYGWQVVARYEDGSYDKGDGSTLTAAFEAVAYKLAAAYGETDPIDTTGSPRRRPAITDGAPG